MSFFKDKVQSVASLEACSSGNNAEDAVAAIKVVPVANSAAAYVMSVTNAALGQASVITIPDPGAATSKFVLQDGANTTATITTGTVTTLTSTTGNITNLKYGATPTAQVDPASCTVVAVAGAANTATVTVTLKDGSGTTIARVVPFEIYKSSAADGLTLGAAASTGWSVASGGLSRANGGAVTTSIRAVSSASGACVLSLLDTNKATDYIVLVLNNGIKISAQLSAGSYG